MAFRHARPCRIAFFWIVFDGLDSLFAMSPSGDSRIAIRGQKEAASVASFICVVRWRHCLWGFRSLRAIYGSRRMGPFRAYRPRAFRSVYRGDSAHFIFTVRKAEPAATAQRLDGVRFEFRVASSAWLTSERSPKKNYAPRRNFCRPVRNKQRG
jgi:hypothetical protein